jgi:hypothetical protein
MNKINENEFFMIRDIVVKANHRMKDKNKAKQLADAWGKIEHSWYESLQ